MKNTSGLKPLGQSVLVKPYQPEWKATTLIKPPDMDARYAMVEQRATVVEVGPEAWCDEKFPRAKPGDNVYIAKFAGHMAKGTMDGEQYRLVHGNDIFCQIAEEIA